MLSALQINQAQLNIFQKLNQLQDWISKSSVHKSVDNNFFSDFFISLGNVFFTLKSRKTLQLKKKFRYQFYGELISQFMFLITPLNILILSIFVRECIWVIWAFFFLWPKLNVLIHIFTWNLIYCRQLIYTNGVFQFFYLKKEAKADPLKSKCH